MKNKLYTSFIEFKKVINEELVEEQEDEDLYHDIDWELLEMEMTQWFKSQPQKLDYDTFVKTFAVLKSKVLEYKMLN